MNRIKINTLTFLMMVFFLLCFIPAARADATSAVSIGRIDYDQLTMQVYYNNNSVVYYSTDNINWSEVEGTFDSATKSCTMDISWISKSSDVTLYFKGDVTKMVKQIIVPMQNTTFSVDYDKALGEFTFENAEESDTFEWRKASDYNWTTVDMNENSSSYMKFMNIIETYKLKGATIIIRLPQVPGTGINDIGMRPSVEKSISIVARAAAPTIRVNASKLTLNTTNAMEYYDAASGLWMECSSNMSLFEIAPDTLYVNGGKTMTIRIRKTATDSTPYSKTAYVKIPGQGAKPTFGGSSDDVSYYYMNSKLIFQFNHASTTKIYQYTVVKEDDEYNVSTASWRDVKTTDLIYLSSSYAPSGSKIYVRKKGNDADTTDISDLVLASASNSFVVKY